MPVMKKYGLLSVLISVLCLLSACRSVQAPLLFLAEGGRPTRRTEYSTVYSPDECIGAIVNGVCHGSILPKSAYHRTCYGEMLNGQCTGPMF
jgi:hypothetical protein